MTATTDEAAPVCSGGHPACRIGGILPPGLQKQTHVVTPPSHQTTLLEAG